LDDQPPSVIGMVTGSKILGYMAYFSGIPHIVKNRTKKDNFWWSGTVNLLEGLEKTEIPNKVFPYEEMLQ
jgi:hypothetical protein